MPVEDEQPAGGSEPSDPSSPSKPSTSKPSSSPDEPSNRNPADPVVSPVEEEPARDDENPFLPVDPDHIPAFDPDYPGLDHALVPEDEPAGCSGGFDAEAEEFTIRLDEEVWGVRLHAEDGFLFANDHACTGPDDEPMSVEGVVRLKVLGGAERNVIILDLSRGDFGARLLESEGGFYFDMGGHLDHFLLRGSPNDDDIYIGGSPQRVFIGLTSTPRINVWIKQADALTLSLGPGHDGLSDIGRLNVGLYDVDSGSVLNVDEIGLPMRLYGGAGNDNLRGGGLDDLFEGGDGDDVLIGLGGNDFFDEGASMNGADVINGGDGLDTSSYSRRTEALTVRLCTAAAQEGCPASDCDCAAENGEMDEGDTVVNVESLRAGSGNDSLIGTAGDDYLYGSDGDDRIEGLDGSDVLQGGPGLDELLGGDGVDICDAEPDETIDSCEI